MKNCNILVVEDETLIAASLVQTLTSLGYTVPEPVATGEDAIRAVKTQQPDLVLMDIKLIGAMDGIEAAEKIRAIADIPIVYLTAYTDDLRLAKARLTEPYGYIVKPTHSRELNATIEMALYKHALDRKLKESERQFRALSENSQDYIMRYDKEHRHTYANPACLRFVGMFAEQFIKKTHRELGFPPDLCALWGSAIDQVFATGQPYRETFAMTADEGEVVLDWRLFPEKDAGGNVVSVLGVARDITARKRAEEVLRKSEEQYRSLLEHVPELILVHQNGIILYTNPAAVKTLGYQPYEALNRQVTDFIAPEFHERVAAAVRRRMSGETVEPYEIDVMGKDGSRRRMIINGTQIKFEGVSASLIILVDITERKRAEEALRESESFNRGLVENLPDYIAIYGPAGNILHVNPASATVLGYSAEKLVGTPVLSYVAEEYRDEVVSRIIDRREGGKVPPYEIDLLTYDGLRRSVIVKGTQIQYRDTPATLLVLTDITERKRAEVALRESEARYRSLFEGVPLGLYRTKPSGQILDINPALVRLLGYPDLSLIHI